MVDKKTQPICLLVYEALGSHIFCIGLYCNVDVEIVGYIFAQFSLYCAYNVCIKNSNLHCTRNITLLPVTSVRAHLCSLAPGQHKNVAALVSWITSHQAGKL